MIIPEAAIMPADELDVSTVSRRSGHRAYRWYVLLVLMLVYAMNLIDRQILTILAPYIKADLSITDAQLGLLFGTTFALFYGLFGIPLGRLADGWSRVRTLALGLSFWSIMTMAGGAATNFLQVAGARICVGVGEASASPAAISLLSDHFPKSMRSTVLAIYSAGLYIGMGLSLMLGGAIVGAWDGFMGLKGWQAAFIIVGAPGLLLALLVFLTLEEPTRGAFDDVKNPYRDPHPFRTMVAEMATMFPPWSFVKLREAGAARSAVRNNVLTLIACGASAAVITLLTDRLLSPERRAPLGEIGGVVITSNVAQWVALAIGVYASVSWAQAIRYRDPVAQKLLFGTPAFTLVAGACGVLSIYLYAFSGFLFLYGTRYLGFTPEDGLTVGAINAAAGGGGILLGGWMADWAKRRHPAGRMYLLIATISIFTVATAIQYLTSSIAIFYVSNAVAISFLSMYSPIMLGTSQDLMIPRTRGTGSAVIALVSNMIGLGLGPYMVGFISDVTGDLRVSLLSILGTVPFLIILLLLIARVLPDAEAQLHGRARAAGEMM